ncbi:TPA: hypothetical protein DDZ86_02540 [Candidatus Dependentiae bacterium]|nr:MAG: hypothetical protein UW09_C0001G0140 [candidate division TM6 bacterium GW2011_GWF2_43_87]HBL98497.1 hypothetical protein [Candidatus Dependentiae bacterium]
MNKRLFLVLCILGALLIRPESLLGYSFYSRTDPYPVFTAANPWGSFTAFQDCEQAYRVRFSGSVFRQNACRAGDYNDELYYGVQPTQASKVGPSDVQIGDMYGPWNILGLFYAERHGSTKTSAVAPPNDIQTPNKSIQDLLSGVTGLALTEDELKPVNYDGKGTMSVPIEYRKYGGRFEFDFCTCYDVGASVAVSIAQAQQCPWTFVPNATGSDNVKALMKTTNLHKIAHALGLSLNHFCKSEVESAVLGLYWRHCFEPCAPSECMRQEDPYRPTFAFTPFIKAEIAPFGGSQKSADMLFGLPFGNGGHLGYGMLCGFTANFFETVLIGCDAGMTAFSSEHYANWPVPTNTLQAGMFPRRADLDIRPGNNWCFGLGFWAPCFVDNFSASVEFRYVHHCTDSIDITRALSLSVPTAGAYQNVPTVTTILADNFPPSNIALGKMINESCWSTCMVNAGLTYDISRNLELGLFWQAPVRQRYTYRSTTVLGSVVFSF